MYIKLEFSTDINPVLYAEYSRFIYKKVKKSIHHLVKRNYRKYKIREPYILDCSLIKWRRKPLSINLVYYIENCLELVKIRGVYYIKLNEKWRIPHSFSKVSLLIRILEYGTNKIPELPLIRRVFFYYQNNYQKYFIEFMKERMMRAYKCISLR